MLLRGFTYILSAKIAHVCTFEHLATKVARISQFLL